MNYARTIKGLTCVLAVLMPALWTTARADTNYVSLAGGNVSPYTNWATAANDIQDCIDDAAVVAGDTVMVSNGWYDTGGRTEGNVYVTNRVVVDKDILLISLSGPGSTFIVGDTGGASDGLGSDTDRSIRGVYNSAGIVSGFTVTNGHSYEYLISANFANNGGGVLQPVNDASVYVTNCVIKNNAAAQGGGISYYGAAYNCEILDNTASGGGYGGGTVSLPAYNSIVRGNSTGNGYGGATRWGSFYNCLIYDNTSRYMGAIAWGSIYNCTVVDNNTYDASGHGWGAAVAESSVSNCIVYYNDSASGPDNWSGGTWMYSCTVSGAVGVGAAPSGPGNITNEPAFWSRSGDDYRLNTNSPCIDAGVDMSAMLTDDFIGTARPQDGNNDGGSEYDIGCYEYIHHTIYWTNHYVIKGNAVPVSPYTNWTDAADNIQDAIDVSGNTDWVVVSNGWYDEGGQTNAATGILTNRVVVDKYVWLKSVNGP